MTKIEQTLKEIRDLQKFHETISSKPQIRRDARPPVKASAKKGAFHERPKSCDPSFNKVSFNVEF